MAGSQYGGAPSTTMPAHPGQYLDWTNNADLKTANHWGTGTGFTYMFPVSKYVEAYAMGPVWNDSVAYRVGNQPYNYTAGVLVAHYTPAQPNHLTLVSSAPRYSSAGVQQAQLTMGQLLATRAMPYMGG